MRGMSRFLSPLSRGREGSAHEAIWLEGERAGNTGPGGEGREMRESGSGGVMERLGPRRDAQGGGEQRAGAARRRREGTAGPGRRALRLCGRATRRLPAPGAARRFAFLAPGRAASRRGRGPRKGYICTKCLRRGPLGLRGGGCAARSPGEVRGGGGRPRSAQGDIRLPARRAHRVSEGTFLPPSGRGQPIEGAPLLCSPRALHAARAPQPEPVLSGGSPRLRGSPSLPQDAGERSPLCQIQVRASPLAVTLSQ